MTAPMFPVLNVALSDGREFTVRPVMIDMIRVERVMGSFTDRQMEVTARCAFHAARRTQPDIPEDFDAFAELIVSLGEEEQEANPTTAQVGTG